MAGYEVFKSFFSEEEALATLQLLTQKGIDAKVEKTNVILDKVIIGDGMDPDIHVKLRPEDFSRANQIIDDYIQQNLAEVPPDYYLHSFSDVELLNILNKPDEWSNQDVIIAKKLLAEREYALSEKDTEEMKKTRINELRKPEKKTGNLILVGYFLAVLFFPGGLIYGLYMLTAKKILPDGSRAPVYDKEARVHFVIITVISLVLGILTLLGYRVTSLLQLLPSL